MEENMILATPTQGHFQKVDEFNKLLFVCVKQGFEELEQQKLDEGVVGAICRNINFLLTDDDYLGIFAQKENLVRKTGAAHDLNSAKLCLMANNLQARIAKLVPAMQDIHFPTENVMSHYEWTKDKIDKTENKLRKSGWLGTKSHSTPRNLKGFKDVNNKVLFKPGAKRQQKPSGKEEGYVIENAQKKHLIKVSDKHSAQLEGAGGIIERILLGNGVASKARQYERRSTTSGETVYGTSVNMDPNFIGFFNMGIRPVIVEDEPGLSTKLGFVVINANYRRYQQDRRAQNFDPITHPEHADQIEGLMSALLVSKMAGNIDRFGYGTNLGITMRDNKPVLMLIDAGHAGEELQLNPSHYLKYQIYNHNHPNTMKFFTNVFLSWGDPQNPFKWKEQYKYLDDLFKIVGFGKVDPRDLLLGSDKYMTDAITGKRYRMGIHKEDIDKSPSLYLDLAKGAERMANCPDETIELVVKQFSGKDGRTSSLGDSYRQLLKYNREMIRRSFATEIEFARLWRASKTTGNRKDISDLAQFKAMKQQAAEEVAGKSWPAMTFSYPGIDNDIKHYNNTYKKGVAMPVAVLQDVQNIMQEERGQQQWVSMRRVFLMNAIEVGNKEVCQYLISRENVNPCEKVAGWEQTPLEAAFAQNNKKIIDIIKQSTHVNKGIIDEVKAKTKASLKTTTPEKSFLSRLFSRKKTPTETLESSLKQHDIPDGINPAVMSENVVQKRAASLRDR